MRMQLSCRHPSVIKVLQSTEQQAIEVLSSTGRHLLYLTLKPTTTNKKIVKIAC